MRDRYVIIGLFAAVGLLAALLFYLLDARDKDCSRHGGHMLCRETRSVGMRDGKPVILTNEDCRCRLADGGEYEP